MGGSAGTSNGTDAGSDGGNPVQTVACPMAPVIQPLAAVPVPVRLPLCLLPDKCCYNTTLSDGMCAVPTAACGDTIETFTCDGPEDCSTGNICCSVPLVFATGGAAALPLPPVPSVTNTVCTTAQACAAGRRVCHAVADCAPGWTCAAAAGLPAPYKVCSPIITAL